MNTPENDPSDDILGRLRHTQEADLDTLTPPAWAKPVGWILVVAIVALVVIAAAIASPL